MAGHHANCAEVSSELIFDDPAVIIPLDCGQTDRTPPVTNRLLGFQFCSPGGAAGRRVGAANGRDAGARVVEVATPPTEHLRGRVRRGLAWGIINSVTLRLGTLTLSIVLARLLAPEAFGAFAVAIVIQTILINFADLGMSADLIRNPEWRHRAPTVSSISLLAGGLLSTAMIAGAPVLASSMGNDQAAPVIAVMSLSLIIAAAGVAPYATLQREFQQSRYFLIVVTSFLLGGGLTVLLIVAFSWGAMALAVGKLVEQTCDIGLQFGLTHTRPRLGFDRSVARSALAFGLPVCGANALSWLVLNVDYIVVGRIAGAVALGLYVLAFSMASWPVNALVQAVRNVALPGFARLDSTSSAKSFVSSFALVLTAGLLVAALLSPLSIATVNFVYGPKWHGAAGALGLLAVFGAMRLAFDLMATFLIARGGSRPVLLVQVIWVAALVPAMIVCVRAWGIVGAGVAHLAIAFTVVLPAYILALGRQGVPCLALVRAAAPPIGAALVSGAAVWAISQSTDVVWQELVVGGSTGILVYLALLRRWLRSRLSRTFPTDRQNATRKHRRTARAPAGWQSERPEQVARTDPLWRYKRRGVHRVVRDRRSRTTLDATVSQSPERAGALVD
jgi:lipopolysaccharide exporter